MYPIFMICKSHRKARMYIEHTTNELLRNIPKMDNIVTDIDCAQGLNQDNIVVVLDDISNEFVYQLRARFDPKHIIYLSS